MAARRLLFVLLAVLLAASFAAVARAETLEYMLPMRDGVELHTLVDLVDTKPRAVVMDRSPYGEDAIELLADIFLLFGFHAVRQDMRGTKKSQGNFTIWHNAANDAYDTMEWIVKQNWSNGEVYSMGASADGLAAFSQPLDSPPWLKAQFLIFASALGYPVIFPGGAFRQALAELWLNTTVPNNATACIEEVKANEAPGPWWNALNMSGHWQNVNFPSAMWSGWYDIFLVGNLLSFDGYQKQAAPSAQGKSRIVIDPLGHCQSGHTYFEKGTLFGSGRIALPLLLGYDVFKNDSNAEGAKAVTFYVMGPLNTTAGGYWTTLDDWPTLTPTSFFFNQNGALSSSAPTDDGSASFVYDPANPVPTVGGNNLKLKCGPLDQRSIESRSDVLVFTSQPLTENLFVTGPVDAVVYVSSNCTDTDFTAKLTDVYPDGTSQLIQDGIVRMRWRDVNIDNQPKLMKPGEVYQATISLWNTSYVFEAGHSIRVAISSSNYPRFSANPNNGLPLIANGTPLVAENTLYFSDKYPSSIILPVVSSSQLPPAFIFEEAMQRVNADPKLALAVDFLDQYLRRLPLL